MIVQTSETAQIATRNRSRSDRRRLPLTRSLPLASLTIALGLLLVALANNGARDGASWGPPLWWLGVSAIFVPTVILLTGSRPTRSERAALLLVLGLGLYLVKVLHSPTQFTFHDEFGEWRVVEDILRTRHLYASSPILGVYPVYPALEIVASAIVRLTGLSIFSSSLIVVGAGRIVLTLALFQLLLLVSRSERVAGLGTALYLTNPNFVYFDSQAAYESLALPLGTLFVLLALRSHAASGRLHLILGLLATLIGAALIATHHMTAYASLAFLLAVAILARAMRNRSRSMPRAGPEIAVVIVVAIGAALWAGLVATSTYEYLYSVIAKAVSSAIDFVLGRQGAKRLFTNAGGLPQGRLAKGTGYASVALVLVLSLLGLRPLWQRYRMNAVALALALSVLLYPATLLLRLTKAGTETSNRASEFLFVGIGLAVPLAVERVLAKRAGAVTRLATAACIFLIFAGGIIVGWAPSARQPGGFLPAADARSISGEGIAAAHWARSVLGAGNRIATDRTDKLLMGSYGHQDTGSGSGGSVPYAHAFFDRRFRPLDRRILQAGGFAYLEVDKRLSSGLPLVGKYFDPPERFSGQRRLTAQSLAKFDTVKGMSRVFDSGNIRIYDIASALK
jgi:hypothetical protein